MGMESEEMEPRTEKCVEGKTRVRWTFDGERYVATPETRAVKAKAPKKAAPPTP